MTLYDNHERSLIGDKWFAYGDSEKTFTLIYHEVVQENEDYLFVNVVLLDEGPIATLLPVKREDYNNIYPIQDIFPKSMEVKEAMDILKTIFS